MIILEFAKYYNVSNLVEEMQKVKEINYYPTGDDKFVGVYICIDSNDFWISRINKDLNDDYDREDGKYLIERNKIDIYEVMDELHELYHKKLPDFKENDSRYEAKNKCHNYIEKFKTEDICKAVILLDDYSGLSKWDNCEADSLKEAIGIIDGGYGILTLMF